MWKNESPENLCGHLEILMAKKRNLKLKKWKKLYIKNINTGKTWFLTNLKVTKTRFSLFLFLSLSLSLSFCLYLFLTPSLFLSLSLSLANSFLKKLQEERKFTESRDFIEYRRAAQDSHVSEFLLK